MSKYFGAFTLDLNASDVSGGVASAANPEGVDLYVTRVVLNVTTHSTAAATVDAGIASTGNGSADNLLDGTDVGSANAAFDNIKNPGTNGKAGQKWGTAQFFTISKASGATAGLKGTAHIEYIRLG